MIFKKLKCVFTIVINIVLARQSDFPSLAGWSVSKNNIKPPQPKKSANRKYVPLDSMWQFGNLA